MSQPALLRGANAWGLTLCFSVALVAESGKNAKSGGGNFGGGGV
jgi:hypothetical protein